MKASLDAAIWKAAARYKKVFGGKGDLSSTARCFQRVCSTADNAYSRFWQNLNAMDWVNTGHAHYSDNAEGCCPYCSRELPTDFEEQFLACFDEKYSQDCSRLVEFGRKYNEYMTASFIEPLRRYIELIPQTGVMVKHFCNT